MHVRIGLRATPSLLTPSVPPLRCKGVAEGHVIDNEWCVQTGIELC